jgi:hypothetical protein
MEQDTSPEQQERYYERLRSMPLQKKAEMLQSLNRGVRAMAEAGIRMRFPNADAQEVKVRLAVRLYGREQAQRVFGPIPEDAI